MTPQPDDGVTCQATGAGIKRGVLALGLLPFSMSASADAYDYPFGEWRGQAQYQAIVKRASDPAGHAVVNLVVNIDPQGKVIGTSTENGCRLLGIAKPGLAAHILRLDVTLRSCAYERFNRVFIGHIAVNSAKKFATLELQAVDVTPGSGGLNLTIQSTMRR